MWDAVVIGGGPAGLQGALSLARGQRRVVVLDAGPPRNARAVHLQNFVTRDGVSPAEFRRTGRAELATYGVEVVEARVTDVTGAEGDFVVHTDGHAFGAAGVLLALGMVDVLPELPGLAALWGDTVFTCPFCHGHAVRGRRWAVWAATEALLAHAVFCRAWTDDVIAVTDGAFPVDAGLVSRLADAGVGLEQRRIVGLATADDGGLGALVLDDGERLARDALVYRPPQRQTALVERLGLAVDDAGYVVVDAQRQTSRRGIYAAGDLLTPAQAAIGAAASAAFAAAGLIHAQMAARLGWAGSR